MVFLMPSGVSKTVHPQTFYNWVTRLRKKGCTEIPERNTKPELIPVFHQDVVKVEVIQEPEPAHSSVPVIDKPNLDNCKDYYQNFLWRIKLCLLKVIGKLEHYNAKQLAEDGGRKFVSMDDSRNRSLAENTGMTRKAFCEYFEIPYRTLQDWELGNRKMPEYLFRLMEYKLQVEKLVKNVD